MITAKILFGAFVAIVCFLAFLKLQAQEELKHHKHPTQHIN